MIRWLGLVLALLVAAPVHAEPTPLQSRAETLVGLLKDGAVDRTAFTPQFLAEVPLEKLAALSQELRRANGSVLGLASLTPRDATETDLVIDYEQAQVRAQFAIEPAAPHRFIGLFVTGVSRKGDSFAAIVSELKALPGITALRVARLPRPDCAPGPACTATVLLDHNGGTAMATASSFKLFVLDALVGEIAAKRQRWDAVVPLGAPSLPSGVTQDWPGGTAMTLQTLATQMISISDNTATDTLMAVLGRSLIDATRAHFGATPGSLPVLTTLEAFSLKAWPDSAIRMRWSAGSLAERRQAIGALKGGVASIDRRALAGPPVAIDTIEWPATMGELAAVMGALRASPEALAILAVNPALAPDTRNRFAYVGYKGGSETGVFAQNWLLRTRSGSWLTVNAAWNNRAAAIDNAMFEALATRAVALLGS